MSGMPEIIGESQASTLESAEERIEEDEPLTLADYSQKDDHTPQPGIYVSPLRLRLADFSGEGERAPPMD